MNPLTLLTPAPASADLIVQPVKGESGKVVAVLQRYFQVSRTRAREIVHGCVCTVDTLQVRELNGLLQKRRLKTKAHLATCPCVR